MKSDATGAFPTLFTSNATLAVWSVLTSVSVDFSINLALNLQEQLEHGECVSS